LEYTYALNVAVVLWVMIGAAFLVYRAATAHERHRAHHGRPAG
jgi:hypothetical protein